MSYKGQQPADVEAIDASQCQGEKIRSAPFRVGGPPTTVERCREPTRYIAVENAPGKDKVRGAMGVCLQCAERMSEQLPNNHFTLYLVVGGKEPRHPKSS